MSEFLSRISKLSPQRLALLAAELNDRVEALERERTAPIAIVGMGCRYPGGVRDAESLWNLLCEGVDAIREVPSDRWNVDAFYDANPDTPGKMTTRWGGFIDSPDQFDPKFFGIAPAEAVPMDPQQRLLLETAWEALEDAGIPPSSLAGSPTGVFLGICNLDYGYVTLRAAREKINAYFASGLSHAIAAGRISYLLGLEGPSLAVDTSCSASLMAVHLACQSLRRKESHLALAGGVNLILNPEVTIALSQSRMMAPDGRCKAFSDDADGFVRAEGSGMIVLKRFEDAVQDGNRILAVIRGTAANQDGRSSGLTAPNGRSQEAVIEAALADAGLSPDDIQYVEAHGTGTALGDPIEIGALGNVFAERSPDAGPLRVGSIKSNFGHLESAAGVAGLMKLVLSLEHRQIPASLHCRNLNHRIDWNRLPVRVSTKTEGWPASASKRAGGVSSFGFSGTNVHVIVEEHMELPEAPEEARPELFPISAKTKTAMQSIAQRLSHHIAQHESLTLTGIARTLQTGRSHFEHRFAFIASSREELLDGLHGFEKQAETSPGKAASHAPRIGFVFSDDSVRMNTARELYDAIPVFRESIQRCEEALLETAYSSLGSLLYPDRKRTQADLAPEVLPLASFAIQYAMAEVWRSCGLQPALVLGTGSAEYVAACCAGVLGLKDALLLLVEQGRGGHEQPDDFARRLTSSAATVAWFIDSASCLRKAGVAASAQPFSEMRNEHCSAFLTMSSRPTYQQPENSIGEMPGRRFASMDADSSLRSFLQAAAGLYMLGCDLDLSNLYGRRARMVSLPTYPFERERYWLEAEEGPEVGPLPSSVPLQNTPDQHAEDWLYELAWEPKPLPERTGSAKSFAWILDEFVTPPPTESLLRVDEAGRQLQPICGAFARTILERLGLSLTSGKEFTLDTFCRNAGVAAGRDRIVGRLFGILIEDGLLECEGDLYRTTGCESTSDPDAELAALKRLYPEIETELAVLQRCTSRTVAVLKGNCDPMQLVFAEGSIHEAEQMYEKSPLCRYFNEAAQDIIAHAIRQISDRTVQILEIGAGTGATTASVLPAVAHGNVEYTFTDISPVFLSKARKKFKDFTRVNYKLLNIERSPVEQRFTAGSYDIVLAANVLHATADLRQTIAHVRQLLRPGGLLLLIEGERPERWLDMTFGLTDGWWRVMDRDLRPEHPLISAKQWQALFRSYGMSLSRAFQYETGDGKPSQQVLMLACADEITTGTRPSSRSETHWVIFSDRSGIGPALANLLRKCGERCELIPPSAFAVKPENALEDLRRQNPNAVFEIVYLCGVDAVDVDDHEHNIQLCVQTPIRLMQVVAQDTQRTAHLCLVTCGAQGSISHAPTAAGVQQAMLWGAGRVFSLEHPDHAKRIIDLDPTRAPEESASDLLRELLEEDVEDQIAYRDGKRLVPRLQHAPSTILGSNPGRLRSDASYLITGGLGSVGLEVAKWAAAQGAGHLVLLGRTGANNDAVRMRAVEDIRASGTPVTVISGDVASAEAMEQVFTLVGSECPELRGVFHAATVQTFVELSKLSEKQISEMLRPKVQGTYMLHEWTRKCDLDFFIAFSSTASITGSHWIAHYAAANQFLDNFAYLRRALGLPMVSVNWGAWERAQESSFLRHMGFLPMPSAKALRWMTHLITTPRANIVIADVNWKILKPAFEARRLRPILSSLGSATAAAPEPSVSQQPTPYLAADKRRDFIEQSIISASSKVLGFRAGEIPPLDVPLTDLGLDSLMAVDLRNRLQTAIGRELPATIAFDYPTISGLAGMLETMLWATENSEDHASLALQDEIRI